MIEISKLLGTILGVEEHKDFVKIKMFYIFYEYVDHLDGTQNLKIQKYHVWAF